MQNWRFACKRVRELPGSWINNSPSRLIPLRGDNLPSTIIVRFLWERAFFSVAYHIIMLPFPAVIIGTDILRQSGIVRCIPAILFAHAAAQSFLRSEIRLRTRSQPDTKLRQPNLLCCVVVCSQGDILIFNNRLSCVRGCREEEILEP